MKFPTHKAQSALELLIIIGAVLFVFISLMFIFQQNLAQKSIEERNSRALEIALSVQNELNIAASARDGYERNFELPSKIIGHDYNISIVEEQVYLQTTDGKISLALPAQNVTGQIQLGQNIIKKSNGQIFLNQ